jgi:dTDP-4-dehydrorhamnose 3,5-epimerase
MHYQNPPHAELKIVHCTKGKILDIAVDLRAGSKTFLKWHAEELSCQNNRMLIIPEGFAHGFQSLTPNSEILYLHTNFYKPEVEDGVLFNDTRLAISWPLPVSNLSDRDKNYCLISNDFSGIEV